MRFRLILSAVRLVLSISALAWLGATTASAQAAGATLELAGVPATATLPGGFSMTVSGSTGTTSHAQIDAVYGPAPCGATVEGQLEAGPYELLATPAPDEVPAFGFAGTFSIHVPVGQAVAGPGLYTICVFMEASEESEAVEPEEEETVVATASATFMVLPASSSISATTIGTDVGARCVVPHVRGRTFRFAEKAIARAHCALGRVRKARSVRVRKGHVTWQSRRAGLSLPEDSRVSLVVSTG